MHTVDEPMNESGLSDHATDATALGMVARADDLALVQQAESPDRRAELYARLRTIIETATESIRTLKDENAALQAEVSAVSERNVTLDRRLRAATVDLESDERALRESADLLDQLLRGEAAVQEEIDGNGERATSVELSATAPAPIGGTEAAVNGAALREAQPESLPRRGIFNWADR